MASSGLPLSATRDSWAVTASHFGLRVDGYAELGLFQKVSGLGVTVKVEPVIEGGQNDYVHKLPGAKQWQDLELERGIVNNDKMLDWLNHCTGYGPSAALARSTHGAIILYDDDLRPLRKWHFFGAFPVSWSGPSFDVDSDTIITEKLVLTHAGLKVT